MTSLLDFLHTPFFKVPIGMAILSIGGLIVIELKNLDHGAFWILGLMVSVWAAEVGAYFVGKRFGKTKLAPHVSPGKTVEGLLGGLVFALLIFVPLIFYVFDSNHAAFLVAAVIVTVLVSVMGDLFESKQKRFADLKDSSQVLPGHGGVLDRIDSLLSAAPFFAITLILLGYW
jgi:phosphatidate cytidylyltransferase